MIHGLRQPKDNLEASMVQYMKEWQEMGKQNDFYWKQTLFTLQFHLQNALGREQVKWSQSE